MKAVEIITEPSIKGSAREGIFDVFRAMRKILVCASANPPPGMDAPIVRALKAAYQDADQNSQSGDEEMEDGGASLRYVHS